MEKKRKKKKSSNEEHDKGFKFYHDISFSKYKISQFF